MQWKIMHAINGHGNHDTVCYISLQLIYNYRKYWKLQSG